MMMTIREKKDIEKWRRNPEAVNISLHFSSKDDDPGKKLYAFCKEFSELVPEISIIKAEEKDIPLSEIKIPPNVQYNAVPEANELAPFLEALSPPASEIKNIPEELLPVISKIRTPAILKIFISPQCPYCPQVVSQCLALARVNSDIAVSVVDGNLFPDETKKYNIRSVPATILDDNFRWTGLIDIKEMIQVIVQRDAIFPGAETLMNIIQDGRAEDAADMMSEAKQVFPAFIELLTDDKWSVRLGAMAVFEYLAGIDPELCSRINAILIKRFSDSNDQIKGDIIYLLGESGNSSVIPFLITIIKGDFTQEVMEAAKDALNTIIGELSE